MTDELSYIQQQIGGLTSKGNIVTFLVFGTAVDNVQKPKDLDAILVVKQVNTDLSDLFTILKQRFEKLDVNIYTLEEIEKNLSFYTREFKLEYLAKGLCLYGENIFIQEFAKVNDHKYKQSLLIRSIEHLQSVRQKYLASIACEEEKRLYLQKYFIRISKNLLLYKGLYTHRTVNELELNIVFDELIAIGLFRHRPCIDQFQSLESMFGEFELIGEALIKCKVEFDSAEIFQ